MRNLTVKQSKFLNLILEGKTQFEAYKEVYSSKLKPDTIKVKASKLFNSEKIQIEYKKALSKAQDKAIYTRVQATEDLKYLIEESKADIHKFGIKQSNVLGLTKGIEQMTAILGLSVIDNKKIEIEKEKLEISKSKLQKDNDNLQKENAQLLRKVIYDE